MFFAIIYRNVDEKDQHSISNHGHVECHIILQPTAGGMRVEREKSIQRRGGETGVDEHRYSDHRRYTST